MTVKSGLTLLTSLLLLTSCDSTKQGVSPYSGKPIEAMQPCSEQSFYDEMDELLNGAEGVREAYLLDYAERAERCNIDKMALVEYINGN